MKGAIKKYRANPDFLLREVAGEAVLIPVGEAGVFENSVISLSDTCSFLWKLFQEPHTEEEVIAEAKKSIPIRTARWSRVSKVLSKSM